MSFSRNSKIEFKYSIKTENQAFHLSLWYCLKDSTIQQKKFGLNVRNFHRQMEQHFLVTNRNGIFSKISYKEGNFSICTKVVSKYRSFRLGNFNSIWFCSLDFGNFQLHCSNFIRYFDSFRIFWKMFQEIPCFRKRSIFYQSMFYKSNPCFTDPNPIHGLQYLPH